MSLSEQLDKMCRVCLSTSERHSKLISLFSGGCAASEVPMKMMNICNIEIRENDGLPNMICQKCVFLVKVTDCFKKQLQMSDQLLRKSWIEAKNNKEGTFSFKFAVNSSDSEIEDLAYNPQYISDEVKAEVEKAFRKKHEMCRKKEYDDILKFLQNLGKKRYDTSKVIKKEIVESERSDDSIETDNLAFNTRDSLENANLSNDKSDEFHVNNLNDSEIPPEDSMTNNSNIIKMEDSALDSSRKILQSEESAVVKNPETLKAENSTDFRENEAVKICQPAIERNIDEENVDPNIIVISDTSDEEGVKFSEKMLKKDDKSNSNLCLRGKKRKITAPLIKKTIVAGTPKIQVKKIYRTLQVVKPRKTQPKTVPRTYFLCTSCNVRLKSVADVLLHHNEIHSPNKNSLSCRMCNKNFPTKSELLEHFNQHVETHLFRCFYCPNEFVLKDNLTRHMLSHTNAITAQLENKQMKINNENLKEEKKFELMKNELASGDEDSGKENKFTINS